MDTPLTRGMARATALTRAGKLDEATALIQSLLQDQIAQQTTIAANDVIEGEFTTLPMGRAKPAATGTPPHPAGTGLRNTLRDIAAGGFAMPKARPVVDPVLPHGAQFLSRTHSSPHGSRMYRLYIPAKRPAGPMPLVIMLHGCTQSPEDFAIGTGMNAVAEDFGALIAYPAQTQTANANKCWNWFRPEDQRRDHGEPALIAGIVRDIQRSQPVDATRVYIAGLSAGGAAAAIMGAVYPDIFAAVGVHSGLPVGSAQDMPSAVAAMKTGSTGQTGHPQIPTIVFHGTADTTVNPVNGTAITSHAISSALHAQKSTGRAGTGRSYQRTRFLQADGRSRVEHWAITAAGHAWAGGHAAGSFTDPTGPDASQEMMRFFLQHHI